MKKNYDEKQAWVLMNMHLNGDPVDAETASKITAGDYVLNATIEEHMAITSMLDVLPLMRTMIGMEEELRPDSLKKFYRSLTGGREAVYRKTTPILFHLSYNPVLPLEIEPELVKTFSLREIEGKNLDAIDRAVYVHNSIIRIYPFESDNEIIARAAMEYMLMSAGLPLCPISLSEQEYNGALAEYLKKGREQVIGKNLRTNMLMLEDMEQENR